MATSDLIDEIAGLYERRGRAAYGERVSQLDHALQTAQLAEREGAGDALIVAALLHDIGHLLDKREDAAARGIDDRHEHVGAGWLERRFGPAVAAPVRAHVDAKRYLCAVEPAYFDTLSPASVRSLDLQGGPMSEVRAEAFIGTPGAAEGVRLRRWDDAAKVAGCVTPGFDHYRPHMARLLAAG